MKMQEKKRGKTYRLSCHSLQTKGKQTSHLKYNITTFVRRTRWPLKEAPFGCQEKERR